jgi:outer membrane protein W
MVDGVFGNVNCEECSMTYMGFTSAYILNAHDQIKPFVEAALIQQTYEDDYIESLTIDGQGLAVTAGINYEFEQLFFGVKYRVYLFDTTDEIPAKTKYSTGKFDTKIDNGKSFLLSVGYRF